MQKSCDLKININGQQIFLVNEKIISKYCGRVKKILNHHKRRKNLEIRINDFPGGPEGFELVSRFCYNKGKMLITVANVPLLHCCAIYLGMTEEIFTNNLLQQTETFLKGMYFWKWNDILASLMSCELLYTYADCYGLLEKIICTLLPKIAQNSDVYLSISSSSSSSSYSSPDCSSAKRFSFSTKTTPEKINSTLPIKAWWFDDLASLHPKIIEKLFQCAGAYKTDNNNLVLTGFLLHYLKTATQTKAVNSRNNSDEYAALAETAVYGVILVGNKIFSCRGLFWVLRIVSRFGMRRECRSELEKMIGGMLEQATLDDLLISGHDMGVYYDVNLVIRLVTLFVDINGFDVMSLQKLKRVGRLVDKYLREISPDHNLKISKFLGVAECLPESARDCFDGVYRAIDIYIESHPMTTFEERSRLCRCLNFSKLSFEASKDMAKNPRIPPRIAMQALISQQTKIPTTDFVTESPRMKHSQIVLYNNESCKDNFTQEKKGASHNLERMQRRVVELEKLCIEMNGQMSKLINHNELLSPATSKALLRFC